MFREDADVISEILAVLPLDEMEKEFAGKDVTPIQFITFITKRGIVGKIVTILKNDNTKATIIDIAKAVKFYKNMYKEVMEIMNG